MKRKELLESREYWIANIQLGLYEMMEDYRVKNKLNRTELARELKVSKGYLSQILNGDFDHKISKLVDTAIALKKVPIIKYEDMDKYIMHDSLNISTTIGLVRDVDITANIDSSATTSFTSPASKIWKTDFNVNINVTANETANKEICLA